MLTLAQQELAGAWDDVAQWAMYVLMREGLEAAALIPLARFTRAAEWIVRREARSEDPRRRQLAAMLAGRMGAAEPEPAPGGGGRAGHTVDHDLLNELFDAEARRVRETPHESAAAARAAAAESAGVVWHVVDAAAHWARHADLRAAALELMRRVLEASLAGEAWTNLERAAMALARHGSRADLDLLARLRRALEAAGDDGSAVVARLLAGQTDAIHEDEAALGFGERAAAEYRVTGEPRDALARLLDAAEEFEARG